MTATFHQLLQTYLATHRERLKGWARDGGIDVPPEQEIREFRSSVVGHALANFYHNVAMQADKDLHGGGAENHDVNTARVDAALEFFALQEAWDLIHEQRKNPPTAKGEGDERQRNV